MIKRVNESRNGIDLTDILYNKAFSGIFMNRELNLVIIKAKGYSDKVWLMKDECVNEFMPMFESNNMRTIVKALDFALFEEYDAEDFEMDYIREGGEWEEVISNSNKALAMTTALFENAKSDKRNSINESFTWKWDIQNGFEPERYGQRATEFRADDKAQWLEIQYTGDTIAFMSKADLEREMLDFDLDEEYAEVMKLKIGESVNLYDIIYVRIR